MLWLIVPLDALLLAAHQLMLWLAQGLAVVNTDLADAVMDRHAPPWWTVALCDFRLRTAGTARMAAPMARRCGVPLFIVVPPTVLPGGSA